MTFSLDVFERLVYSRQHRAAADSLWALLDALDADDLGPDSDGDRLPASVLFAPDARSVTRLAGALSCLFADPQFLPAHLDADAMLRAQRWLSAIFAASGCRSADHVIRALDASGERDDAAGVVIADEHLPKFCMLYACESEIALDWDALWRCDRQLAAGLCVALLSPRLRLTPAAWAHRGRLLDWLADTLDDPAATASLPLSLLHEAWLNCTQPTGSAGHRIRRSINAQLRRAVQAMGLAPLTGCIDLSLDCRPVMLVVLDELREDDPVWRWHASTLEAARERFCLIGTAGPGPVDQAGRALFDEFVELRDGSPIEQLQQLHDIARLRRAQVLYMPCVGLRPLTMLAANARLAPVQAMGLGHPASSMSKEIDYVVIERDCVGDTAGFCENLMRLPADGMPLRAPAGLRHLVLDTTVREAPDRVQVVIDCTPAQLDPLFLEACARIADGARSAVHFTFVCGPMPPLFEQAVTETVRQFLGERATLRARRDFMTTMSVIAESDLFLDPFPIGNRVGLVDAVGVGLVGICRSGGEVHERIAQALFERLQLPAWLVAQDTDDYVAAAIRLVDDHPERAHLRRTRAGAQAVQALYRGRPALMGQLLWRALQMRCAEQPTPADDARTDPQIA